VLCGQAISYGIFFTWLGDDVANDITINVTLFKKISIVLSNVNLDIMKNYDIIFSDINLDV